jgi:hypothetical protein
MSLANGCPPYLYIRCSTCNPSANVQAAIRGPHLVCGRIAKTREEREEAPCYRGARLVLEYDRVQLRRRAYPTVIAHQPLGCSVDLNGNQQAAPILNEFAYGMKNEELGDSSAACLPVRNSPILFLVAGVHTGACESGCGRLLLDPRGGPDCHCVWPR